MGTILFLLLFFFIILPLFKIVWRGWQFTRRWKDATAGMREAYNRAAADAADGRKQYRKSSAKKKKIDPSVGEYVTFEELNVDTTTTEKTSSDGKTASVRVESQVEDAVWEEIK